ncbi:MULTISPECIES: polysaccharide deacetylase family protein [Deinococcus]|uniref:polysaccharide deacetylase family protein n=1 Tax=Deinococcus TaxID=1298 RepID=UPI001055C86C|nr:MULTISPECIES: polysaccharide deacetylase family protein [Deinococcus]TDE85811.1 DUF2334 domain-containing protein [Deinococcus sp. S9]
MKRFSAGRRPPVRRSAVWLGFLTVTLGLTLSACGGSGDTPPATSADTRVTPLPGAVQLDWHRQVPLPFAHRQPIDPAQLLPPLADLALETPETLTNAPRRTVRVYYSDPLPASSPYRDGGSFHALMLRNLLGQYANVDVELRPISQYQAGAALSSRRTFYIGTVYDEPIPAAFLDDVKAGAPVTWIGYNLWELGSGLEGLGLSYRKLHTALTPEQIAATFTTVEYKNYAYHKYPAPMEINEVAADPARTRTLALARDAAGDRIPYLVQSGNFYYVADNPFQYITPTDRYLVMADSLGTMLGDTSAATCRKRAILRLEDISPADNPEGLRTMLDVIQELRIPFALTVIPEAYYQGVKYDWKANGGELLQLYRAAALGGAVIQHGYTHNYHGLKTPEGDSGDAWEFWDKEAERPLAALTPEVAERRVRTGRQILLGLGVRPQSWTTPHYEADTTLYPVFNRVYPSALERRMYQVDGVRAGQFFPYPVRDAYGTLVLPENLGNIQEGYLADAVLEAAEANRNLACPYASLFVHPYLVESDYTGPDRLSKADFRKLITDIQAKGYTFVNPLNLTLRVLP